MYVFETLSRMIILGKLSGTLKVFLKIELFPPSSVSVSCRGMLSPELTTILTMKGMHYAEGALSLVIKISEIS